MHDLLVTVGSVFSWTAMPATLHMVHWEGRSGMSCAGIVCVALPVMNAAMYYGSLLRELLPTVREAAMAMWVAWLFALLLTWSDSQGTADPPDRRPHLSATEDRR